MSPTCCQQLLQRAHNTFTQASYNVTQCQPPFHIVSSSHDYPLQLSTATLTTYLMYSRQHQTVITTAHRSPPPHANSPGPQSKFTTPHHSSSHLCASLPAISILHKHVRVRNSHLPSPAISLLSPMASAIRIRDPAYLRVASLYAGLVNGEDSC